MGCLDEDTVLALVDGGLEASARAEVEAHLASCAECSEIVAGAAGAGPAAEPSGSAELATPRPGGEAQLLRGAGVGRYVILDLVGRGGMGEVYAAYDPQLDRKIALKLLHESLDATGSTGRARLLREAKAIARLSHPNVVVVHDAGAIADANQGQRVFLAMEFVEGQTLADWLASPRSWREIRDVFAAAGEGLAAAHDAELVHRDFKPQNVMVGRDGSVRVMDFGLAGDSSDGSSELLDPTSFPEERPSTHTAALTRTGALIGTPLYMAPEQFLARGTDARTDQFSFCVALHEALYGERPFPSDSFRELLDAVVGGRAREPAQRSRAPAFLRRLIARGLKADPAARWPSMRALLAELRHDPGRRTRTVTLGLAGLAVMVAVAAGAQRVATRGQRVCRAGGDKLAGIWDFEEGGERRQAVRRALLGTGQAFAGDTWSRVARLLDDYARGWTAMYTDACEATHVRGEQSEEVLDLRMTCLQGPRTALRALTNVLSQADSDVVVQAVNAVQALPPLDRCADVLALRAAVPPPRDAATRASVEALRPALAEVKAFTDTGRWSDARRMVRPVVERARAIGYTPLVAEALAARGLLEGFMGDAEPAVVTVEEALWDAVAAHEDALALECAAQMEAETGYYLGRFEESERWDRLGRALLARLGPGHDRVEAWLYQDRAISRQRHGDHGPAMRDLAAALALKRKVLPALHPDIGFTLLAIAESQEATGDLQGALASVEKVLEIFRQAYGSGNPLLAQVLSNRGEYLNRLGRNEEAERDLREAVDRWSNWLGPSHVWVAYAATALGKTLIDLRRPREAVPVLERALRIRETSEPNQELVAETRFALARARLESGGSRREAVALAESARDTYRQMPAQAKHASEVEAWLAAHTGAKRGGRL